MTDESSWTDQIIRERMELDQDFSSSVESSQFSRQQWGLIMTAVEFRIEHPEDEQRATLVADTSALPSVMSELDKVANQSPAMGGQSNESDGLFSKVREKLGVGGSDGYDQSDREAAESLVEDYAIQLQQRLEQRNKWDRVRKAALSEAR